MNTSVLDTINRGQGVSEILAVNDHEFLVIRTRQQVQPANAPQAPTRRRSARSISPARRMSLGLTSFPPERCRRVFPVKDPVHRSARSGLQSCTDDSEKVEGLAWSDLPDGRHVPLRNQRQRSEPEPRHSNLCLCLTLHSSTSKSSSFRYLSILHGWFQGHEIPNSGLKPNRENIVLGSATFKRCREPAALCF